MRVSRTEQVVTYGVLAVAALVALYPLGIILVTALSPDQVGAAGGLHPENFAEAWERGNFGTYLTNSLIVSGAVVLPAYTRVDAAVFWDVSDRLSIQANLENLFDVDYYPSAHGDNNIAPGAPFNAAVTLRAKF